MHHSSLEFTSALFYDVATHEFHGQNSIHHTKEKLNCNLMYVHDRGTHCPAHDIEKAYTMSAINKVEGMVSIEGVILRKMSELLV